MVMEGGKKEKTSLQETNESMEGEYDGDKAAVVERAVVHHKLTI